MSEIPGDLKFLKSHEWARVEDSGHVTVGISEHAQGLLGDLVYVELPNVGDTVEGKVKPVIYKTFPLREAAAAHALMESSQHIGKIVLTN